MKGRLKGPTREHVQNKTPRPLLLHSPVTSFHPFHLTLSPLRSLSITIIVIVETPQRRNELAAFATPDFARQIWELAFIEDDNLSDEHLGNALAIHCECASSFSRLPRRLQHIYHLVSPPYISPSSSLLTCDAVESAMAARPKPTLQRLTTNNVQFDGESGDSTATPGRMYSSGAQTGVSTPRSQAVSRPLTLTHGSLEHTFLIPTALHFNATQLKDAFLASLPEPTDELALDDEPSSETELVARYLGFIAKEVDEGEDPESYIEVLKLIILEFERQFLRGNEVHAIAASLPGIVEKKLVTVHAYYAARRAAQRSIRAHESALLREAADENASIYAVFGGQGNIEEYFEELREVYNTYPSLVEDFVSTAAAHLQLLARDPKAEKLYPKGLDVLRWLNNPDTQPDIDYLVSAPVSFPLIGLTQLAHYVVTCRVLGTHPGHLRGPILRAPLATHKVWSPRLQSQHLELGVNSTKPHEMRSPFCSGLEHAASRHIHALLSPLACYKTRSTMVKARPLPCFLSVTSHERRCKSISTPQTSIYRKTATLVSR